MPPSPKTTLSIAVCLTAALFLAASGVAGLQPATQQASDVAQPEAAGDLALPERVVLPEDRVHGSSVVGLDAGGAVDGSGSQLAGAYERYLLEERLAAAETDAERRTALNRSVDDLEDQLARLRQRERSARQAFRSGEIDAGAYLAALRSVNDRAEELEQRADLISPPPTSDADGLADVHGASQAGSRVTPLRGDIIALQGPVRDAVGERMRDDAAPQRFHVSASPNGTVASYIDGDTYYREATRPNVLARGDVTGLGLNDAYDLANQELYPQFTDRYAFSGFSTISSSRIYRVLGERQYDHGSIESYIDAVSQNVFWEAQQMTLTSDLPRAPAVTNASGSLSVSVRPTYGTGPASVEVVENGTTVANATVIVDGEPVAETDENGVAWVVLPEDSPTVSVTAGGETARVGVDWETVYA